MIAHGFLNRRTDIFILPRTAWGLTFNPYDITQTHSIFVKLQENTLLGMSKIRAWSIFYIRIALCQNFRILPYSEIGVYGQNT